MKNKLIVIGWTGIKRCYLNMSREEAIKRYAESERTTVEEVYVELGDNLREFEFDDEFGAYDVWSHD